MDIIPEHRFADLSSDPINFDIPQQEIPYSDPSTSQTNELILTPQLDLYDKKALDRLPTLQSMFESKLEVPFRQYIPSNIRPEMIFKKPFFYWGLGVPKSGKTAYATYSLLFDLDPNKHFSKIIILCTSDSSSMNAFKSFVDPGRIELFKYGGTKNDLEKAENLFKSLTQRGTNQDLSSLSHWLIIIDDMAGYNLIHKNSKFKNFANTYANNNVSCIILTQNMTDLAPCARTNATIICVHRVQSLTHQEAFIRENAIGPPRAQPKDVRKMFETMFTITQYWQLVSFITPIVIYRNKSQQQFLRIGFSHLINIPDLEEMEGEHLHVADHFAHYAFEMMKNTQLPKLKMSLQTEKELALMKDFTAQVDVKNNQEEIFYAHRYHNT